jgi:hypothetical protein
MKLPSFGIQDVAPPLSLPPNGFAGKRHFRRTCFGQTDHTRTPTPTRRRDSGLSSTSTAMLSRSTSTRGMPPTDRTRTGNNFLNYPHPARERAGLQPKHTSVVSCTMQADTQPFPTNRVLHTAQQAAIANPTTPTRDAITKLFRCVGGSP